MIKDKLSSEIIQKIEDIILAIGGAAGVKVFDHVALDQVEWVANAIYNRIRQAKDEVVKKALDPENDEVVISEEDLATIGGVPRVIDVRTLDSATKDTIIQKAVVKTAKEINSEQESLNSLEKKEK